MTWTSIEIEIHTDAEWELIGVVNLLGSESLGTNAETEFVYDLDYATKYSASEDYRAISCSFPVTFEPIECEGWPPFLVDLFPQGAALKYIVEHYRISDRQENYWKILKTARMNPPGNLRVVVDNEALASASAAKELKHPGFTRQEVLAKGAGFLEYMVINGAPIAGSTGAGGAAPKFLLREDSRGMFHADGCVEDAKTRNHWLVKFPRGRSREDADILAAEAAYGRIAKQLGFDIHLPPIWEADCLFVSRFDRVREKNNLIYLGLESFYSIVGLPEFGSRLRHETYLAAVAKFSSNPQVDIVEYVLRDFLNLMMGNTDNHGRNSSILKGKGWSRLAPIYDFAPMKFDPEGIVRNTRWGDGIGDGNVHGIAEFIAAEYNVDPKFLRQRLQSLSQLTVRLDELMRNEGVAEDIIDVTQSDRDQMRKEISSYLNSK